MQQRGSPLTSLSRIESGELRLSPFAVGLPPNDASPSYINKLVAENGEQLVSDLLYWKTEEQLRTRFKHGLLMMVNGLHSLAGDGLRWMCWKSPKGIPDFHAVLQEEAVSSPASAAASASSDTASVSSAAGTGTSQ